MVERTIMAYEMDDGRSFVGRAYFSDTQKGICKLRDGCMIRKENLPAGKSYEEGIIELYKKAVKEDVVQFGLEGVVKPHQLVLKE